MRVFEINARMWKSFEGAIPSKRYDKSGKNAMVLLDYNQLCRLSLWRDQDVEHLTVTTKSIGSGSGIDYPKVEPEPIKSHHKILTRNDRIPSRFAGRCRLRRSDVAKRRISAHFANPKRTTDLFFQFFLSRLTNFLLGYWLRRKSNNP